eukprot:TRINITY_DN32902_c0_g1_i1.p1 TRINITY_DN32902_c0_g1~~TRINITY_DN32902_c0_g1_i1.p1  ORF type:complete len:371 (-),score=36.04 TRINITY_DN32902_c0_g1_i1:233-1345(-)
MAKKKKCDKFCKKWCGECWEIVLLALAAMMLAVLLVTGFYFCLLASWFHDDKGQLDRLHDPLFWTVLVFFVIPAFVGSGALFYASVVLLVRRPNVLKLGMAWADAAFFAILASAALFTLALRVVKPEWQESFLAPAVCLVSAASFIWVPYSIYSWFTLMKVSLWHGVRQEVTGAEFDALKAEVAKMCEPYENRYNFNVVVQRAYHVSSASLEEQFDVFCGSHRAKGKPQNRKLLFHGTSRSSAKSIIESGFRLPNRAGMFGKGVYFADTPLKSMQYARTSCRKFGTVLMCDVELGNTKMASAAQTSLDPGSDLQRGWIMRTLFRQQSFDSLTARSGFLGAVRVPEYVIYRSDQAVPRYLIFCEQQSKTSV